MVLSLGLTRHVASRTITLPSTSLGPTQSTAPFVIFGLLLISVSLFIKEEAHFPKALPIIDEFSNRLENSYDLVFR